MTEHHSNLEDRLLAYIDDELSQSQRHDFEQELEANTDLRSKLQTLRAIDAGLSRLSESNEPEPITQNQATNKSVSTKKWIGYAAALLIAATLFIVVDPLGNHETFNAGSRYRTITRTFEPQVICDTPEKFASYTKDGYGKAIHADFDTAIQLVGWRSLLPNYNPEKSATDRMTRILMAQTPDGTRVIAFFVPRGFPKPILETEADLYMHAKSIQGVRVYEVSPLPDPLLLDILH